MALHLINFELTKIVFAIWIVKGISPALRSILNILCGLAEIKSPSYLALLHSQTIEKEGSLNIWLDILNKQRKFVFIVKAFVVVWNEDCSYCDCKNCILSCFFKWYILNRFESMITHEIFFIPSKIIPAFIQSKLLTKFARHCNVSISA